jgi:GR25 family glycosyltransferase involved in LPS biosynthesis
MLHKIQKIITYDLPAYIRQYGILIGMRKIFDSKLIRLQAKKKAETVIRLKTLLKQKKIVIISSKHCLFVANLISHSLQELNFETSISHQYLSENSEILHIVIAPQLVKKLPKYFIAFQMEQSVSSRWFKKKYFRILKKSLLIFDYSLNNISFLVQKNIALNKISFMPISYNPSYRSQYNIADYNWSDKIYDLCFYGDTSNHRRKAFIETISHSYPVKIFKETFGKDIVSKLAKTKIILNIHYYDNALLETTRIYECISLDVLVISEKAIDQEYHTELNDIVEFIEENDIVEMIEKIKFWLENPEKLAEKISANRKKILEMKSNLFDCYLKRFLAAYTVFPSDRCHLISHLSTNDIPFYCLSISETPKRRAEFLQQINNKYNVVFCDGIKHLIGWVGCGMSFQYLIRLAIEQNCDMIIICEDDSLFVDDFGTRIEIILKYLKKNSTIWDIYSAMVVDLADDTKILSIDNFEEEEFIFVNKIISMVFNIYNKSSFETIMKWDEWQKPEPNIHNTIDEYIRNSGLKFVVSYPFLVHHKEDSTSTIWGNEVNNNLLYSYRFNKTLINFSAIIKNFKNKGSL